MVSLHHQFLISTSGLIAALASCCAAEAAPLTFAFSATVEQTYNAWPDFVPPISVEPGDLITGQFTFEPVAPGVDRTDFTQPYGASASIAGFDFATPVSDRSIEIRSKSNVQLICDCGIGANPNLGPYDEITLWAALSSNGIPSIATAWLSLSVLQNNLTLFVDDNGYLRASTTNYVVGGEVPGELETWNALAQERKISFGFRSTDGKYFSIGATLGDFTIVPEPQSAALVALMFLCVSAPLRETSSQLTTR